MNRRTYSVVYMLVIALFVAVSSLRSTNQSVEVVSESSTVDGAVPKLKSIASEPAPRGESRSVASQNGPSAQSGVSASDQEQMEQVRAADRQDKENILRARAEWERKVIQLSNNPRSRKISLSGRNFVTLPTVFAVPEKDAQSISGYSLWQNRNGYSFFEIPNGMNVPPQGLPVASIEGGEGVAVLTGAFSVKYRSASTIDSLSQAFGLSHVQTFEALHLSYFQSEKRNAEELVNILNRLRADPRVETADLEVVDKRYVSR